MPFIVGKLYPFQLRKFPHDLTNQNHFLGNIVDVPICANFVDVATNNLEKVKEAFTESNEKLMNYGAGLIIGEANCMFRNTHNLRKNYDSCY